MRTGDVVEQLLVADEAVGDPVLPRAPVAGAKAIQELARHANLPTTMR